MELEDLIINHELRERPSRAPEPALDELVTKTLAAEIPNGAPAIVSAACAFALDFCGAESAAISLSPGEDSGEPRSWAAVAGRMKHHLGGVEETADAGSAIGLHAREPLLLREPDRHFAWMRVPGLQVMEALVTPIYDLHRNPRGSIWVLRHGPGHLFDDEDVRLLVMLALRATAALEFRRRLDSEQRLH